MNELKLIQMTMAIRRLRLKEFFHKKSTTEEPITSKPISETNTVTDVPTFPAE